MTAPLSTPSSKSRLPAYSSVIWAPSSAMRLASCSLEIKTSAMSSSGRQARASSLIRCPLRPFPEEQGIAQALGRHTAAEVGALRPVVDPNGQRPLDCVEADLVVAERR